MARRRTKKRTTTHRRRSRMSGMGGSMETILGVVGGVVAGKAITKFLPTTISPTLLALGQIGVGIFLPKMVKGNLGTGLGYGLVANGASSALTSFSILSGVPQYRVVMNGPGGGRLNTLAGGALNTLTGVKPQQQTPPAPPVRRSLSTLSGNDDDDYNEDDVPIKHSCFSAINKKVA